MDPIKALTDVLVLALDSMRISIKEYRSDSNARYSYLVFRTLLRKRFASIGARIPYWPPSTQPRRARIARILQASGAAQDTEILIAAVRLITALNMVGGGPDFIRRNERLLFAIQELINKASGEANIESPMASVEHDTIESHSVPAESPARFSTPSYRNAVGEPVDAEYIVFYGTNRLPLDTGGQIQFSSERDTTTHLGACRVFVPYSHKIGSIGSPWWRRLIYSVDDRLRLLQILYAPNPDAFWEFIHFNCLRQDEDFGIIFVHGYNVSFEDAALRAALRSVSIFQSEDRWRFLAGLPRAPMQATQRTPRLLTLASMRSNSSSLILLGRHVSQKFISLHIVWETVVSCAQWRVLHSNKEARFLLRRP
jgi:hypothetical protein